VLHSSAPMTFPREARSPRWFGSLPSLWLLFVLAAFAAASSGCFEEEPSYLPDAALPGCSGVTTRCEDLSGISCAVQAGCQLDIDRCTGTATDVCRFMNQQECPTQPECVWDGATCVRNDFAPTCEGQRSETNCGMVSGCFWVPGTCSGAALRCDQINEAYDCVSQRGCEWH
jgi:hypothetical protein